MGKIINKALEGVWNDLDAWDHNNMDSMGRTIVCDPFFWQALGKACGWKNICPVGSICEEYGCPHDEINKYYHGFHEINLTDSWSAAVDYLRSVCGIETND